MLRTFYPTFPTHTNSFRIFMAGKTSYYLKTVLRIAAYRKSNQNITLHVQRRCALREREEECVSFLFLFLFLSLECIPLRVYMMRTWFHFIPFENMEMPYKFIRQCWRFVCIISMRLIVTYYLIHIYTIYFYFRNNHLIPNTYANRKQNKWKTPAITKAIANMISTREQGN